MSGRTFVLEHKTSSRDVGPGSVYWRRLTLDPQVSVYLDAVRAAGYDVEGVLYDVLRKPAHRQAKGDKSPEDFERRCVEAICEEPDKYLQRGTIVRLAEEARDAAADLWQTAEQIRAAQLKGRFPRNPDSCFDYERPCDYWGVCSGETDVTDPLVFEARTSAIEGKRSLPVLSQSGVRAWRACPKRYYYAYELGRRPRMVSDALRTGKAIHSALEVWWTTRGDLDASLAKLARDAVDPWGQAKSRAMVRCYHARWESDLARWDAVQVEKEFVVPLVNPESGAKSRTWEVGGRLDALATERTEEKAA